MATRYVWHGASASASPYDTWDKAATTLTTGLSGAAAGDVILIADDHTGDNALSADTTYTIPADRISIISTNRSSGLPSAMAEATWLGNNSVNRSVTFTSPARKCFLHGLTIRTVGSALDSIIFTGNDAHYEVENCYLWNGNTNVSSAIFIGAADVAPYARFVNTTFQMSAIGQLLRISGKVEIIGGSIKNSNPSFFIAIQPHNIADMGGCFVTLVGVDLSECVTIMGDSNIGIAHAIVQNCKMRPSSWTPLSTQQNTNSASSSVEIIDCSNDDTHYAYVYANALGTLSVSNTIYASDGAEWNTAGNKYSWQIVTTANARLEYPFRTPWISVYNESTSAITPSLEGFMDGSTTVIQNDEVWGEFAVKATSGQTIATIMDDRMAILGSPADQTSSKTYADWQTGTSADSVFKLAATSTITPQEIGTISARVCVGAPSITVYVDPQIRT